MLTSAAATLMITALISAQPRPDEAKLVAYAKALDVSRLDATLAPQPLAAWIAKLGVPATDVTWRSSDCSLMPDPAKPDEPRPLCVDFIVTIRESHIKGLVVVGTQHKGIEGPARFESMFVIYGPAADPKMASALKLSELRRLIAEVRSSRIK